MGVLQLIITLWISRKKNYPKENKYFTIKDFFSETLRSVYILIMPIFIIGIVVLGITTATESAAMGVLYAAIIGFIIIKDLTVRSFIDAIRSSIMMSAKIMIIIAFSKVFIWILAFEHIPELIANSVIAMGLPPTIMMFLVILIILAAGTFIDVSPAILLLTPVLLPGIIEAGVSPVLFGVVLVTGLAVGACTPPVGNCLNVCAIISGLGINTIFRGAIPFLIANVITLFLITFFPELVLWLPTLIMA